MKIPKGITKTIIMIIYKRYFAQYCSLYEYGLGVLLGSDFPIFSYTFHNILASWNNVKSPLLLHRQS